MTVPTRTFLGDEAADAASASRFPATRWSVVAAAARGGDQPAASAAWGELCRAYWYPLYVFARRKNLSAEDAEDATQSFLAEMIGSDLVAAADPSQGRLRSFLVTAFSRDLADRRRDAARLKRGGGTEIIPLEFVHAEDRFQASQDGMEPVLQFEAEWAQALLETAVGRVESDYEASGRKELFAAIRPFLGSGSEKLPDQAKLAFDLGMSHVALRRSVSRLRDRFRATLRMQVADTLRDPTEEAIDEELRALREILSKLATVSDFRSY